MLLKYFQKRVDNCFYLLILFCFVFYSQTTSLRFTIASRFMAYTRKAVHANASADFWYMILEELEHSIGMIISEQNEELKEAYVLHLSHLLGEVSRWLLIKKVQTMSDDSVTPTQFCNQIVSMMNRLVNVNNDDNQISCIISQSKYIVHVLESLQKMLLAMWRQSGNLFDEDHVSKCSNAYSKLCFDVYEKKPHVVASSYKVESEVEFGDDEDNNNSKQQTNKNNNSKKKFNKMPKNQQKPKDEIPDQDEEDEDNWDSENEDEDSDNSLSKNAGDDQGPMDIVLHYFYRVLVSLDYDCLNRFVKHCLKDLTSLSNKLAKLVEESNNHEKRHHFASSFEKSLLTLLVVCKNQPIEMGNLNVLGSNGKSEFPSLVKYFNDSLLLKHDVSKCVLALQLLSVFSSDSIALFKLKTLTKTWQSTVKSWTESSAIFFEESHNGDEAYSNIRSAFERLFMMEQFGNSLLKMSKDKSGFSSKNFGFVFKELVLKLCPALVKMHRWAVIDRIKAKNGFEAVT
eukprot:TRINITY_DN4_c0_g2_i1.p1 TRINITY_DN4_c0_g2~~TRINITY_DN4_c0_g2_i1.p1  ORF type:complete len:513 (+),score=179.09 TRINITY_DN4_c0_g2_i1:152-1690(+)